VIYILVDTSIWIDYFKSGENSARLDDLIEDNQIVINDIILAEFLVPKLRLGMPTLKLCLTFNAYKREKELVLFAATPSGAWQ
jgi:predicted nucleic acid-binding protein